MKLSVRIKQRDMSDCGAACLASVAAHHGLRVPVARIRQWASTDKKGTNVIGMISAAEKIGLQAKGVKGPFESLYKVPKPAIVHVILKEVNHHYVVLLKATPGYLEVMDPSDGELHRHHPSEFKRIWSGVMILVMPAVDFKKGNHQPSVLARFWKLVSPHRDIMIQVVMGSMVYTLLGLSTSIYVQKIVDYVLVDGNRNLLNLMGIGMTALLAMAIFIGYTKSLLTLETGQRIDGTLILGYYKHLLHLPQAFFDTMRVGEILSRINDAVKIRTFINDVSINLMVNIFVVLFSFMLMFTYYWKLAIIILLVIPFYCLIFFITNKLNRKAERKLMERSAELESQWVESLNSVATIKRFGIERHANTKTEDKFFALLDTIYRSGLNNLRSGYSTEFISRLFTIMLLWVGAGFALDNEITPGELLSFYALIGYFTGPAASLIGANKVFQNAMIASDRLFEIMDLELEGQSTGTIHLQKEMVGDIQFLSVCFWYGSRTTVLDNFSLTIHRGSVVALVGESGSGKSTVINILQNLYPIHSGSIRFGEYDLKYIDNDSLRQRVSVVPQKIDLFAGNVIENISLGDDEPDMKKVLSISSRLGLLEFVEKLPAGFNTFLGENGAVLSGGQRQRIAIARALYRDPEILILDEATSSLDSVSEKFVQKVVGELRREGKTVILIAHRLSSICGADKIVVIENGKMAEEGTHPELMENKAVYYRLWKSQFQ